MVASFQAIKSNRGLCQSLSVGVALDEFLCKKFMSLKNDKKVSKT